MYAIYDGAPVTTERALMLTHTVHRAGQDPVPVAVVMLDVKRATDRHYRQIGQRALDTLTALGVNVGSTDALAFGRRFTGTVTDLTVKARHCIDQDTGRGPLSVDYVHSRGSGSLPGTTDTLTNDGRATTLPAVDYTRTVN